MRVLRLLAFVGAFALALAGGATAEPDPTFGGSGEISFPNEAMLDVAIDDAGRIVLAGYINNGPAVVRRLLSDGSPDLSFGEEGAVRNNFGARSAVASALAIDSEGRVVVAGSASPAPFEQRGFVARYLESGAPDVSFGEAGVAWLDFVGAAGAGRLRLDASDRPVFSVGGFSLPFQVVRLTADGRLDPAFGTNGVVATELAAPDFALTLAADGSVTFVGTMHPGRIEVRRHRSDGSPDPAFGENGKVSLRPFGIASATAIASTPDGTTLIAGSAIISTGPPPVVNSHYAYVVRLTSSGALDPLFNGNGVFLQPAPDNLSAHYFELSLTGNGSVVAVGGWFDGPGAGRTITLLGSDGVPDVRFGGGTLQLPLKTVARAVALDRANRLVVAGFDFEAGQVARYLLPGLTDTIPPAIEVSDLTADATGPAGATVEFEVVADDEGVPAPAACSPASGSSFPIGDTAVTCTATDAAGNTGTASFVVHVRGADEQFTALRDATTLATLHEKLDYATRPLTRTRTNCLALAYYGQAAKRRGLPELMERAQRIADVLAC